MTIDTSTTRSLNTQMTQQEMLQVNSRVDSFNTQLKNDQKVVSKNSLDQADFMSLLITQLKSQDPTKPMDDKEFIGQMAQFTTLKQMNEMTDGFKNMSKDYSFSKAVGLVNKMVTYTDDTGIMKTGAVDSIKVKNGDAFLNIGGEEVGLNQIDEVTAAKEEAVPQQFAPSSAPQPSAAASQAYSSNSAVSPDVSNLPKDNSKLTDDVLSNFRFVK